MPNHYSGLEFVLPIQKICMGEVEHEIKVVRIKSGLWGVRCYVNGDLNQEIHVKTRGDIGRAAYEMFRTEDKCGNISQYASRARDRHREKLAAASRLNEVKTVQ